MEPMGNLMNLVLKEKIRVVTHKPLNYFTNPIFFINDRTFGFWKIIVSFEQRAHHGCRIKTLYLNNSDVADYFSEHFNSELLSILPIKK